MLYRCTHMATVGVKGLKSVLGNDGGDHDPLRSLPPPSWPRPACRLHCVVLQVWRSAFCQSCSSLRCLYSALSTSDAGTVYVCLRPVVIIRRRNILFIFSVITQHISSFCLRICAGCCWIKYRKVRAGRKLARHLRICLTFIRDVRDPDFCNPTRTG